MWLVFALLSAVFAALTSILAKVGINGVNSNLATALRTVVVLVMAWGMVFVTNAQGGITDISRKSWERAPRGYAITMHCRSGKPPGLSRWTS